LQVIEGTIMEMSNHTLLLLLRSSAGFIYHSLSTTRGRSWSVTRTDPVIWAVFLSDCDLGCISVRL
jgi:hypothetical protein